MSKQVVVVLGSGRSGTSLLMQVLASLGVEVGDNLTPKSEQNPDGGYEDKDIFALHSKLLSVINAHNLLPLPETWEERPEIKRFEARIDEVLSEKVEERASLFAFKDPRTAMFLPLWTKAFNRRKIIPKYILITRDPRSVVNSLFRNYGHPRSTSELFWLQRNCDALIHTGGNLSIVQYEMLIGQPVEVSKHLLKYLEIDVPQDIDRRLNGIVKQNLNRSSHNAAMLQNPLSEKLYSAIQNNGLGMPGDSLMETATECQQRLREFYGWPVLALQFLERIDELRNTLREEKKLEKKGNAENFQQQVSKLEEENRKGVKRCRALRESLEKAEVQQSALQESNQKLKQLYEASVAENNALQQEKNSFYELLLEYDEQVDDAIGQNSRLLLELNEKTAEIEELYTRLYADLTPPKLSHGKEKKIAKRPPPPAPVASNVERKNRKKIARQEQKIIRLRRENIELQTSYSFRLGQILINPVLKPGKNTILAPYYLVVLLWDIISGRGRKKTEQALKESGCN